ncbi:MAG: helix-turn-helix domain-containing protein [Planctomycetota bacterium]
MTHNPPKPLGAILSHPSGPSVNAGSSLYPLAVDAHTLGQMLGLHKNTIEQYRKDGVLPFVNFGRAVRYPVHQVMAALDRMAGLTEPETEPEPSPA